MRLSRRRFCQGVSFGSVLSVGATAPLGLLRAAHSLDHASEGNILVVVQLTGGNDGLNTVIPFRDDTYYKLRPSLAIASGDVLKIDDQMGLHPSLSGLTTLMENDQLSIVQGVGYPNPNRSHFESMDIWHTCQTKAEANRVGWLGRYMERSRESSGRDPVGLHLGAEQQPLAIQSRLVSVPSVRSIEEFQLRGLDDPSIRNAVSDLVSSNRDSASELLGFVQTSTSAALLASERVLSVQDQYRSGVTYPETELGRKLRLVAQLVTAGLKTRIYYVTLDGFDTHSQQSDAHAALLRHWGDALSAFVRDMASHGLGRQVVTLTFSEFGRRVGENASKGTDHGAAAPVFLAGDAVRGGIVGSQPSLLDLDDGDLKFHTDFRRIYATLLADWLRAPTTGLLPTQFESLSGLFA